MSLEQQLIFLFSALGAINGGLLSSYFLLLKREKQLSDYLLGGLLLMLSIRILKSVFLYFNPHLFQLFVQIGLSACLFIGPFLFLYVTSVVKTDHNLRKTWWLFLLPFALFCTWLANAYPFTGEPNIWGPFVGYIYKVWLAFILASAYQLRGLFKRLFQEGKRLAEQEVLVLNVFVGVLVIYLAYETVAYTSYIVGALSFSFLFYMTILLQFFHRNRWTNANDSPIRYANSSLSPSEAGDYMQRLSDLMREQKPYLDPDLTLAKLSDMLGINSKQLSQAVNQMTEFNYSKYIATFRIEEAKRLLLSPEHQHYKIAAIAYESGFNSLSSFNETFRQLTGLTPKAFRKSG